MEDTEETNYSNLLKDMDENQAVIFASAKVRGAVVDTQQTIKRVNMVLDLMSDRQLAG
jgi:hypothetical protein